jgi:hypothetical protein
MKTSISIDEKTLRKIDDYRASSRPIPSLSKAIINLINRGLKTKEEITEIPKEANKIEDLTLHLREPSKGRGGSCAINLPYAKMKELGFNDKDKIDLMLVKK